MAPNRMAIQAMLNICEHYADRHNIMFSTDPTPSKSKTKCIFVSGKKKNLIKPVPLTLYGKELPWVTSATHLGHELHETGTMDHNINVKKAEFINKSTEMRETFAFANPVDVVLSCGISHVKTDILANYVKFFRSLRESPSREVLVLSHIVARDVRTTTGNSLQLLREMTGLDPWSCLGHQVKKVLGEKVTEVPQQDSWRLLYLQKLLEQRGEMYYRMEDTTQLTELIDSICLN